MTTKTKNLKSDIDTFPFTERHLKKLRREIREAGDFHELMIRKEALERKNGMKYIPHYYDIEGYRKKHLTGVYASLREFYDTDIPFLFWSEMEQELAKLDALPV